MRSPFRVSIRRACGVMLANRGNYHYKSKKDGQAVLVKRIKEVAERRMHCKSVGQMP